MAKPSTIEVDVALRLSHVTEALHHLEAVFTELATAAHWGAEQLQSLIELQREESVRVDAVEEVRCEIRKQDQRDKLRNGGN